MKVSIGIPAHNEEANIGRLLDNLLTQTLKDDTDLEEILVVADGCTDQTVDIVKGFKEKNDIIKLIELKERHGLSFTFNTVVSHASDEILIVVNADTLPELGCIARLVKAFKNKRVGCVVGRAVPIDDPETIWGYIHHLLFKWNYLPEFFRVDFEGCCALRRELVEPVPTDILDYEPYIDAAIRRKGYNVVGALDSITYTKGADRLWDFLNQRKRTFFMHLQTMRKLEMVEPRLNFTKVLKTIPKYLSLHPKKLFWFLATSILIAYCYFQAWYDFQRGASYDKWKMVPSTKKLTRQKRILALKKH